MLIPSSAVESMGMGGMLGAAAIRQEKLVEGMESQGSRSQPPFAVERSHSSASGVLRQTCVATK